MVDKLKSKLDVLFACQRVLEQTTFDLLDNTIQDQTTFLKIGKQHAEEAIDVAKYELDTVDIHLVDLLKSFKDIDIVAIC